MHCSEIGQMHYSQLFYGFRHDFNTAFLQQWAGPILSSINYVDHITDLANCHKKIILMSVVEANFYIDLTRQLIQQQNYLVFIDLLETCGYDFRSLIADCPECRQFTFLLGGKNHSVDYIDLNSFYFLTLTDLNMLRAELYTIDQIFQKKAKPYHYLYLNGADKPHRRLLWETLEKNGQLTHALKSYLGYSVTDEISTIPFTALPSQYECEFLDIDGIPPHCDQPRNYRTFKDQAWKGHWVDGHVVPAQYIDTYFTVVTETLIHHDNVFITEKTFKPLLAGHPFIVLSSPGHYKELHSLGFKTFGDFIDESFDSEPDINRRIAMISKEIQKLCQSDLDKFLLNCQSICRYNQQHYISYKTKLFRAKHVELYNFFTKLVTNFINY